MLSPGTRLGPYEIVDALGAGGMGEVYRARDTRLGRTVAIKVLPQATAADGEFQARLRREAEAIAALQHPHICTLYDIGRHEGLDFLVMECLEGETLARRLEWGPLPLAEALTLAAQVGDALDAAHAKGIVHRDVKPANIFITGRTQAKMLDFGVAKMNGPAPPPAMLTSAPTGPGDTITSPGTTVGTVMYMSPEQARGDGIDSRSDLFSFGIVLYEMLTGQRPFSGRTPAILFDELLNRTPPPPSTLNARVTPALDAVVAKALEKDRGLRYQTARDLAADLRRAARELESGRVPAATAAGASPARIARSRRLIPAVIGAVAAALLGAGVYLWQGRSGPPSGVGASGRPTVAVMPFDAAGASDNSRWLSTGLPNMLLTGLAQTPGLDIVSRERVAEIVGAIGGPGRSLDAGRTLEIGRRAGAGALVVGSIFTTPSETRIDAQLQDVTTGRIVDAFTVRGPDVFPLADELTELIRDRLSVGAGAPGSRITAVTTPSLEAFRLFNEGVEAANNLRLDDARDRLERAIDVDPQFAAAYLVLAVTMDALRDPAARDRSLAQVKTHFNRLSERDQLVTRAYEASIAGDMDESARQYEAVVGRYPDHEPAWLGLDRALLRRGPDARVRMLERAVRAIPNSPRLRNNYGYALLGAGRYADAVREFETYIRLNPREANPHDSLGEAYLVMGAPEKGLESYTAASTIDPQFLSAYRGRLWALGMLGRYDEALALSGALEARVPADARRTAGLDLLHGFILSLVGRQADARRVLSASARDAAASTDRSVPLEVGLLAAVIALENGDRAAAARTLAAAGEAMARIDDPRAQPVLATFGAWTKGIVAVRTGKLDAARAELASLAARYQRREVMSGVSPAADAWIYHSLEGEVELAAGDPARAQAAFTAAAPSKMPFVLQNVAAAIFFNNPPQRDGVARAKAARGDLAGAIAEYRALLTVNAESPWTAMLEPRYVLALARLLEKSGDRDGARREYQRAAALWKNADPGLPDVIEARAKSR
jgi:tetratricopeptide (TPR) repeat protein/TolB-like protein